MSAIPPAFVVVTPVFEDVQAATRLFQELAATFGAEADEGSNV